MFRFIRYSVLGLVLALSLTITGVSYADDGTWSLTDNGYKIWNPCPQPNETVTWSSGADEEKYATGKGVIQWFEDGKPVMGYEGDVVKGKANGKGIATWPDGDRYEGDFVDGNMTGKGVATCVSGDRYEGNFINGKMNGYGTYYHSDGTIQQGQWENDEFVG
ncbi:hypothetical protein [Anaeroselena agilis]|uniref:MORN repeat-containing protein n=1 Tax=Anaeroselena agilis TaxID=3063788 RepID=A0ABU3NTH9_9FIRM|nr:hypothetical protein [Selenomonadales bacterium 4137-cl]